MKDEAIRRDFPIDWEDDQYVSRREFFKFLTLASGGLAVGSAVLAASARSSGGRIAFEPVRLCALGELSPGESLGFSFPRPRDLCILVRRSTGELAAYSRRCTHLSCPVNYEPDRDRLYCPCHNGAFAAADGAVLQGPPPHPLPRVELEVRSGEVWATAIVRGEADL
jgi:nitrite reductase/ring-hydroxylating ferredoxin subunit